MSETEIVAAPKYGSFNARTIAATIDIAIIMIAALPTTEWVMEKIFLPLNYESFLSILAAGQSTPLLISNLWNAIVAEHVIERIVIENLVQLFFIAAYTLFFWFRYSTTPGKMLFRLEIRDVLTGEYMSRKQAVIRFLGYIFSGLCLTIGFLWVLCNKKRQGFHDIIANTIVVKKSSSV